MKVNFEFSDMKKFRKNINDSLADKLTEKIKTKLCPVHNRPAVIKWRGRVEDPEFYAETCCDKLQVDFRD